MNHDDLALEQNLELHAAQIASNDRLIAVMESLETKLPADLRTIMAENRSTPVTASDPVEPIDATPTVRQWGQRTMAVLVVCQIITILVLIFK
jgi:hypothetical protein